MINYSNIIKSQKVRKLDTLMQFQKNAPYIVFLHGFMSDLEGEKPKAFLKFAKKIK